MAVKTGRCSHKLSRIKVLFGLSSIAQDGVLVSSRDQIGAIVRSGDSKDLLVLTLVFLDEGVRCLHTGAFSDPLLQDYLRASADLAGVHALTSGEEAGEDLDPALGASLIDLDRLMIMLKDFSAVASF